MTWGSWQSHGRKMSIFKITLQQMKGHLPNSIEVKSSKAFCLQIQREKASLIHANIHWKKYFKSEKQFRKVWGISSEKNSIMLCKLSSDPRPETQYTFHFYILFDKSSMLHQWEQRYWQSQILMQPCVGYSFGAAPVTPMVCVSPFWKLLCLTKTVQGTSLSWPQEDLKFS